MEFVSTVELISACRLEYRVENGEPPWALAELTGRRRLDTRRLSGTLNRAERPDHPQLRRAAPADRTYVQAEMDAVLLAWLGALPAPVVNPAHPLGWAGVQLHPFAWALRAQAAGFLTAPHRCGYSGLELPFTQSRYSTSHLVFGGRTFPALPQDIERRAAMLAKSAGVPLLGITLAWMADGQALFTGATPLPDLRVGGAAFLDALTAAFTAS